jgi:hypothetical protein
MREAEDACLLHELGCTIAPQVLTHKSLVHRSTKASSDRFNRCLQNKR